MRIERANALTLCSRQQLLGDRVAARIEAGSDLVPGQRLESSADTRKVGFVRHLSPNMRRAAAPYAPKLALQFEISGRAAAPFHPAACASDTPRPDGCPSRPVG